MPYTNAAPGSLGAVDPDPLAPALAAPVELTDTATVYRRTAASDGAGGMTETREPVLALACRLERVLRYSETEQAGAVQSVTVWRARFAAGADVRITDRVRINGHDFEVTETDAGLTDAPLLTAQLVRVRL